MRWKGIIALIVIVVIVWVLAMIFGDQWFEARLESLGNSVVGARVEIDDLDVSLLSLHVRWDSLQVTNPRQTMENILTTGSTEFNMQLIPLFSKNVIIENVQVINITSGTPRTRDGKLPKKIKSKKPSFITKTIERLQEQAGQAPAWNLQDMTKDINVDSIMKILDIHSPDRIDTLFTELNQVYNKWDSTLNSDAWQREYEQLRGKVDSIHPQDIKTVAELQKAVERIDYIYTKIDSLQQFAKHSADSLKQDLTYTQNKVKQVDNWIAQDVENAMEKAKLPAFSKENMALFLFGPQIVNKANSILHTVGQVRYYSAKLKSDKPKKEKPPRFKGQTIHFITPKVDPDLWIKRIKISGTTSKGLLLDGEVNDIVSRQSLIGQPTTLSIKGQRSDKATLVFDGEFNYLDEPQESITIQLKEMPLGGMKLSQSQWLPQRVKQGRGQLTTNLRLKTDQIQGSFDFTSRNLAFEFRDQTGDKWSELIHSVFASASRIEMNARLISDEASTKFSLDSNVDELMAQEIRKRVGDKVDQARQELERNVRKRVDEEQKKLQNLVDRKTDYLRTEMEQYQAKLDEQINRLDEKKKNIMNQLKAEKKKQEEKIKKEAKEKLKDLF